jgi:hypothetical protein
MSYVAYPLSARTPAARVKFRREIAATKRDVLRDVLTDIRRKAREIPAWAHGLNAAATSVEIAISRIEP